MSKEFILDNETICKNQEDYDNLDTSERLDVEASFSKWLSCCPVAVVNQDTIVNHNNTALYPSSLKTITFAIPQNIEVDFFVRYSLHAEGEICVTAFDEEEAEEYFHENKTDLLEDSVHDWLYDVEVEGVRERKKQKKAS